MIALLVITNGRHDCLRETVASALANLHGPVTERWMYDDTGDESHRDHLRLLYPTFSHINAGPNQGFGGAIRAAWQRLRDESDAEFVFHLEDDFTFRRPVDLTAMARVLGKHPHLVQLALRRQPWNDHERAAGGIVEQHPDSYQQKMSGDGTWLEHHLFFTTNPCLYRRSLCSLTWPEGGNSEGHFGFQLRHDGTPEAAGEDMRFGYWGSLASGEAVEHIGHERVGSGY